MMDLSPIANAIKSVQAPTPQALPSVAEEMKPVPQAETLDAVPPLPAKGGEAGLGKHLDLYDTEVPLPAAPPKDALPKETQPKVTTPDVRYTLPGQTPPAELPPPPYTVAAEFPFLKPLGGIPLGKSIDARI